MNVGNKPSILISESAALGYPMIEIHSSPSPVEAIRRLESDLGIPAQPIAADLLRAMRPHRSVWRRLWALLNMDILDIWRWIWRHF